MRCPFLIAVFLITIIPYALSYYEIVKDVALQAGFHCEEVGINTDCCNQINAALNSPNASVFQQMFLASSQYPYSGLSFDTPQDLGNFDQCLAVDYDYGDQKLIGKFCTYSLIFVDPLLPEMHDTGLVMNMYNYTDKVIFSHIYSMLSICIPDKCQMIDIKNIIENIPLPTEYEYLRKLFVVRDAPCTTVHTNEKYTAEDIVTLTIIGIVLVLMIVSTCYDVALYLTDRESLYPIFIAFSVYTNSKKLLKVTHGYSKFNFPLFNGLRVISMLWIIAGHGFGAFASRPVTNAMYAKWLPMQDHLRYMTGAPLAVDTFFFMSGFLLAFNYLKQIKPLVAQICQIPMMIIHRYLRLTPALAMVWLFTISLMLHIGTGPLYANGAAAFKTSCEKQWWPFFLYIQNYYNYNDLCMTQTWYLSADMQMFVLSPLLLIPVSLFVKDKFKFTMIGLIILDVISVAIPMIIKFTTWNIENAYDTHSRLCNYLIGITLATYMIIKIDEKPIKLNRVQNFTLWFVCLAGMMAIVFCYHEVNRYDSFVKQQVFMGLMRPFWCICLCWMTYACHHGYGDLINWFLGCSFFQILGKLTYCMYLTHGSIIVYNVLTIRTKMYFTDWTEFYLFCGHLFVTLIVSTIWTLAFESPFMVIEKIIFGGARKSKPEPPKPKEPTIKYIHKSEP